MALRFFDGFDTKTPHVGYGKWIQAVNISSSDYFTPGRSGQGYYYRFRYGGLFGSAYFVYQTNSPSNEWIVGFAAYHGSLDNTLYCDFLNFYTGSQLELYFRFDYPNISVYRGDGTLLGRITGILLPARWFYLEIGVKIDNTSGYVTVKVDGSVKLNLTNQDTAVSSSPNVDTIRFGVVNNPGQGPQNYFLCDDFYLLDKTGTEFNDFLGDVVVYTLVPNADGSTNDWTPNSGTTRYTQVDEIPHDSDTTYIYTTVDGAKQYFDFPDQVNITILAVQNNAVVRKDDSTTRYIKMCAKLGVNEVVTNSWVLSNSYLHFTQVLPRDPANNQWSLQNFNSTQFGLIHSLTP